MVSVVPVPNLMCRIGCEFVLIFYGGKKKEEEDKGEDEEEEVV